MTSEKVDLENLLNLPDEVLLAKLSSLRTSSVEWVAVSAVIDQRNRQEKVTRPSIDPSEGLLAFG